MNLGMNHYVHHSCKPITLNQIDIKRLKCVEYDRWPRKPGGLWFTVGQGEANRWKTMRLSKGDNAALFRFRIKIILRKNAKLLFVSDVASRDQLTEKYGNQNGPEIDWPAIAEAYDGIIVAPYPSDWSDHHRKKWFSCWDIASGCIWNVTAISKMIPFSPKMQKRVFEAGFVRSHPTILISHRMP
jgi:hypothetical protein